jgi:hypothetical protein
MLSDSRDRGLSLEALGALLRDTSSSHDEVLSGLSEMLIRVVPMRTTVERHRGLRSRQRYVRCVEVAFDDRRFRVERAASGELSAMVGQVVRGVVLRSEELSMGHWLDELARSMMQAAEQNLETRAALEQLLL